MYAKENVVIELTFQFALNIVKYCEVLQMTKKFVIANQLIEIGHINMSKHTRSTKRRK